MAYGGGYKGGDGGFKRNYPREMHKVKCSECGKDAEVPFKPVEGRPVYCKECFMKKKGLTPKSNGVKKPEKEKDEEVEESEEDEEEFEEESE